METTVKLCSFASIFITDYTDGEGRALLLYKRIPSLNLDHAVWVSSAGGHMEPDEINDPEACLWREINEELGLNPEDFTDVKLKYVATRFADGEIRHNYYYFGHLAKHVGHDLTNNEGELKWFSVYDVRDLEMPVTARACLDHYLEIGLFSRHIFHCAITGDGKPISFVKLDP